MLLKGTKDEMNECFHVCETILLFLQKEDAAAGSGEVATLLPVLTCNARVLYLRVQSHGPQNH